MLLCGSVSHVVPPLTLQTRAHIFTTWDNSGGIGYSSVVTFSVLTISSLMFTGLFDHLNGDAGCKRSETSKKENENVLSEGVIPAYRCFGLLFRY